MSGSTAAQASLSSGPPDLPRTAIVGLILNVDVDIPILAVFLVLYLATAGANTTIYRRNRARGHKFIISVFLSGFSMARVGTCVLRIAWATRHSNARLALAAEIFTNAGVLVVYLVNLDLAKRLLRAQRPSVGWHSALSWAVKSMFALIGVVLVMIITTTVISSDTADMQTLDTVGWISKGVVLYILVIAVAPLILLAMGLRPRQATKLDSFGHGSTMAKVLIASAASAMAITIAGFKTGTAWQAARPLQDPAWYDSRACFYCFGFMLELSILWLFLATRIDKRFHVPNGSSKIRTYGVRDQEVGYGFSEPDMEEYRRAGAGSMGRTFSN